MGIERTDGRSKRVVRWFGGLLAFLIDGLGPTDTLRFQERGIIDPGKYFTLLIVLNSSPLLSVKRNNTNTPHRSDYFAPYLSKN